MERLFIVTGANGHLGGTVVRLLQQRGGEVRGLILPGETGREKDGVTYIRGDVRDRESMRPLFSGAAGRELCVIHTAGVVDISAHPPEEMYAVNVAGAENIAALCGEYGARLVYVSSVHAIAEGDGLAVITETERFSPDAVAGDYAKSKALATRAVLDAAARGLDAVVVHPSGILGPGDTGSNHLVQMLVNYIRGLLPACVRGGYDFVDVRDVAAGIVLAAEKGRTGQCYILSNRYYEIKDLLRMARRSGAGRRLPVLPLWMARAAAPLMRQYARLRHQRPLYTAYSLQTLSGSGRISHDKATRELGYQPRDMVDTVRDTVAWAVCNGGLK